MADNNTLLDKLDGLMARFEEVSTLITDPAVIADQRRYVRLTKEYKELGELMKARAEYVGCLASLAEAKQLMQTETDPEMRDMAREEAAACETRLPDIEEPKPTKKEIVYAQTTHPFSAFRYRAMPSYAPKPTQPDATKCFINLGYGDTKNGNMTGEINYLFDLSDSDRLCLRPLLP